MSVFDDDEFGHRARRLRLDTLIRLRWMASAGQASALIVTHFVLRMQIPVIGCALCVAASVVLNIALRASFPANLRLNDVWATAILAFDIAQLAVLLFLTGGLENPFSTLFLAPVTTSAVSLPWRQTLILLGLALFFATLLLFLRLPLLGPAGTAIEPPALYTVGLWAAINISNLFVSIYGNRVAREARQLASALTATELMLARAQHLSQLDGLAAAAAHELGTPLATVALVVHELAGQTQLAATWADDLRLVEDQVARCRNIIGKLSAPSEMAEASFEEVGLGNLIEEIAAPHRLQDVDIQVIIAGEGREPICGRNPAVAYGLSNIVENAVGFAAKAVEIRASWTAQEVEVTISDDGPGFPAQVLQRVGEPYISDRAGARRSEGEAAGGLGLGLFISKALLERTGGKFVIANAAPPLRGARVTVSWPFGVFERSRPPLRANKEGIS